MFDVTDRWTYKNVHTWRRMLDQVCGDIPVVICANKVDAEERKILPRHVSSRVLENAQYCEISAKTKANLDLPFLILARQLAGDPSLELLGTPVPVTAADHPPPSDENPPSC
jgi:GTP-binding nuclear protein Ran